MVHTVDVYERNLDYYIMMSKVMPEEKAMAVKEVVTLINFIGLNVFRTDIKNADDIIDRVNHYGKFGDYIYVLDYPEVIEILKYVIKKLKSS